MFVEKFLDFVKSPEYLHKAVELSEIYNSDFNDELFFIIYHDLSILYSLKQ